MDSEKQWRVIGRYAVEKVLGKVNEGGVTYCQIKWLGYPSKENTWEPVDHCQFPIEEEDQGTEKLSSVHNIPAQNRLDTDDYLHLLRLAGQLEYLFEQDSLQEGHKRTATYDHLVETVDGISKLGQQFVYHLTLRGGAHVDCIEEDMRVLFPIRLHAALQRITEALVQNWQNKKMARHTNKEHKETQENKDGTYCKGHSKGETKNDRYKDCQLKKTQTEQSKQKSSRESFMQIQQKRIRTIELREQYTSNGASQPAANKDINNQYSGNKDIGNQDRYISNDEIYYSDMEDNVERIRACRQNQSML